MSDQGEATGAERPSVGGTGRVLTAATTLSAALLAAAFAAGLAALDQVANLLSTAGVVTLLATPAAGLVATFVELRPTQPRAALLALVVLGVLAVSATVALLTR
jgi:hypothetical protein